MIDFAGLFLFMLYCIWVGFWGIINIALEIARDLLRAGGFLC